MCMWQSQAPSGALSFGGSVPAEFDTCWPRLCRPIADAVAAIATIEALLMKVRRAVMLISLCPKTRGRSLDRRTLLSRCAKGWGTRCLTVKTAGLKPEVFGYHFLTRRRP